MRFHGTNHDRGVVLDMMHVVIFWESHTQSFTVSQCPSRHPLVQKVQQTVTCLNAYLIPSDGPD